MNKGFAFGKRYWLLDCIRGNVQKVASLLTHLTPFIDIQLIPLNQYRNTSSISRTKSHNLNVSGILLKLSSLNPLKPGAKLRMKM